MIKSFMFKGLELFLKTGSTKGIQAIYVKRLRLILKCLNNLQCFKEIDFPSARLHELKGNMKGLWSITIQANWRITFRYDKITSDVYIVDYQDYH